MFDIGWTELVVVAIVALVAIGPKELPAILKTVGGWIARARGMAREFQAGVDEILRDADVEKYRQKAQELAMLHPETALRSMLDPKDQLREIAADSLDHEKGGEAAERKPADNSPASAGNPNAGNPNAGNPNAGNPNAGN
jgi:sec-independent protein translocase protein TatB